MNDLILRLQTALAEPSLRLSVSGGGVNGPSKSPEGQSLEFEGVVLLQRMDVEQLLELALKSTQSVGSGGRKKRSH